jgi:hypothetical protein
MEEAHILSCTQEVLAFSGGIYNDPRYTEILKEISHPILIYKP